MSGQKAPLTKWTQEQDDYVKEQYRSISASAIGLRLGKSKSAVIGRAYRLGLGRPYSEVFGELATHSPYRHKPRKSASDDYKRGSAHFYRGVKVMPFIEASDAVAPLNGVGVKIWDLGDGHCRWVIGDPKDLTFCGHSNHKGSSYCPTHFATAKASPKQVKK
jgi:hypothetical protein